MVRVSDGLLMFAIEGPMFSLGCQASGDLECHGISIMRVLLYIPLVGPPTGKQYWKDGSFWTMISSLSKAMTNSTNPLGDLGKRQGIP